MAERAARDVTASLLRWREGSEEALEQLMPLVYDELCRLAARHLRRERADHTLDPAALVHEAYLKLVDQRRAQWKDRAHFFAIAGQLMRRILVSHARSRQYVKRGGELRRVTLDEMIEDLPATTNPQWLALDDALLHLADEHPEHARIVELHFFGGLTHQEIAAVQGLSVPTVVRRWRMARAWLYRYLEENHGFDTK